MEFKGTKGEWTAFKSKKSNGFVYVDSEETSFGGVATCYNGLDNAIQNAKLIAAAPELLKALSDIVNNIDGWLETNKPASALESQILHKNAKKAIEKALK